MQKTVFENIVANRGIVHNEQFLLSQHCFQLYSKLKLLFKEIANSFANMFYKLSAADLLYVENRAP